MKKKYIQSAKRPVIRFKKDTFINYIEVSGETYKAEKLELDTRSRFYKGRLKSFLEAGYVKGRKTLVSQQLILKK